MDRRTDRTIGLVTIITVALVATATLVLVNVGDGFDAGRPSEAGVTPVTEAYPGAPKPLPTPTPAKPLQITLPQMPNGNAATPPPSGDLPPSKPLPAELTSFNRHVGIADIEMSGTTSKQEVAKFTLKPKFSMDATTTDYVLKGKKWKKTGVTRTVVRNGVKATRVDGGAATKEKLTPEEIDQMAYEADPRTLTRNVQNLPGVKKSYDAKTKLYKYTLDLSAGGTIMNLIPKDIRDQIPPAASLLGLKLELYADAKDHAVYASLNGLTAVNAIGIGVIYSDMK